MQHSDPDVLSLHALGEPIGEADLAHVTACARCQAETAALARVVAAARVDVPDGPAVAPPPHVWDRIAAETGVGVAPSWKTARGARTVPGRRWTALVAAAALVVGAAAGSLLTRLVTQESRPSPVVVATVDLAALPLAPSAGGRAMVVGATDEERLEVDVTRLAPLDGQFYEVWLIDRSVKKMLPLGVLRGAQGQFVIPAGLDLREYPVVDVSVQEAGDPAHSGRSVLRGVLAT